MPTKSDETNLTELKQEAIEWLIQLRTHDLNEAQTHAFADWLSQDIRHAEAFANAEDVFNAMIVAAQSPRISQPQSSQPGETDAINRAVNDDKQAPPLLTKPIKAKVRWLRLPLFLAAAWLIAVFLVLPKQSHILKDYLSDYHTKTGEQQNIQLADGSQILLNTNTAVSVDFQNSYRQITLHHGQARFTVAKDPQRPFDVISGDLTVRALGTVFDVYQHDSGEVDVTVEQHSVAARIQNNVDTITNGQAGQVEVSEGQRLRYDGEHTLNKPEMVDSTEAVAWHSRSLFFNDRPLAELIAELDRYRVGRIFLSDAKLNNLRVSGMFSLEDPDEALVKVQKILALQETRLGPWWVLLHR